jgi:hypothetical protein
MTGRCIAGKTTSVTSHEGVPADWYQDPSKVGELRYFDGTNWTEHVTIGGVQTTAPFSVPEPVTDVGAPAEGAEEAALAAQLAARAAATANQSFTVTRTAQRRSEEERALEVMGPAGPLGRFVTTLDGAPGYRFEDPHGAPSLTVSKPSLKSLVEVANWEGRPIGSISKIGRLHSRYDIARSDNGEVASAKLVSAAVDEWNVQLASGRSATISRTSSSPADSLDLADVQYSVSFSADVDDHERQLLFAVPLAIDMLDTQTL